MTIFTDEAFCNVFVSDSDADFDCSFHCRWIRMAQGIPDEVLMNAALIKDLAEVARDAALQQGVIMRIKETPNSSEVRGGNTHFFGYIQTTTFSFENAYTLLESTLAQSYRAAKTEKFGDASGCFLVWKPLGRVLVWRGRNRDVWKWSVVFANSCCAVKFSFLQGYNCLHA